jgi:signal transduction histidine kinase
MPAQPVVLVIDDLPDNVEVLGACLANDYEIECAFSGPEGLALARGMAPDLILLDVMMPEMDGYAVQAALKDDPRTREVPVIFVTAKNDADSESRALAAGAVDFIHKPVNRDVVLARVRLHLALKARERELRELNLGLERRVEERTQALRDALVRAESAHRAKNLFLANVNHELRTPMNVLFMLAELLCRQARDAGLREQADKIKRAGQQLLGLVEDIVDIADLQAGKVRIDAVDFELSAVLDEAEAAWRGRAEAKGLALERAVDPELPEVLRGDPRRLGQILGNFLGNAVKFTERGQVVLRACLQEAQEDGATVRLEVEDQGIGVAPERQAAIFDIFEQADNSTTRSYDGAGLGLAICKQLATLMGGRVGVSSAPGEGSRFWASVRLGRAAMAAPPPAYAGEAVQAAPVPVADLDLDWSRMRRVLVPLTGLLAAGDIEAYLVWQRSERLLDAVLGKRSGAFNQAMESFDFAEALRHLRAVRQAYPQMAAPGSARPASGSP